MASDRTPAPRGPRRDRTSRALTQLAPTLDSSVYQVVRGAPFPITFGQVFKAMVKRESVSVSRAIEIAAAPLSFFESVFDSLARLVAGGMIERCDFPSQEGGPPLLAFRLPRRQEVGR
jgi:hypothetical protein